jgi:hypothetical protein
MAAAVSAILLIATVGASDMAEEAEIRVRLIDAHSGKPFVGRDVQFFGTNSRSGLLKAKDTLFHLQTKTRPDGIAHFQIARPLPYRLIFYSAQANGCGPSGFASFITSEVIRSGIVVPNTCSSKRLKYDWRQSTAHPGEIIIFAVEPRGP